MNDPLASENASRRSARRSSGITRPLVIGVMGSASGIIDPSVADRARAIGEAIAKAGCTLITGACPGLPQEAVLGAAARGGLVLGISPALSEQEHVERYASPVEGFSALIYTGSGLMGREVVNIRSSDIVIIVGGHSGTLGEFAIAYDEGRLIGVLTGTDGVADLAGELVERLAKDTGAKVLFDDDPDQLVSRLIQYYRNVHFQRPHSLLVNLAQQGGVDAPIDPAKTTRAGSVGDQVADGTSDRPAGAVEPLNR